MRVGEVSNLKWIDVDIYNGTLSVFGKARMQQSIPMTDKLKKELSEYQVFCQRDERLSFIRIRGGIGATRGSLKLRRKGTYTTIDRHQGTIEGLRLR
ncbi:hypothetical protein SAMN05444487_1182 [Marininema mesophilum]|uniref:Phage integrase family protein n=2 Tax=Marininema mesophilum TaxID=1048340 RepID=A0A1H3BT07_9BACL|nr:hypothetical protein SAMN05444487_1182 [Marininema mesophilum]